MIGNLNNNLSNINTKRIEELENENNLLRKELKISREHYKIYTTNFENTLRKRCTLLVNKYREITENTIISTRNELIKIQKSNENEKKILEESIRNETKQLLLIAKEEIRQINDDLLKEKQKNLIQEDEMKKQFRKVCDEYENMIREKATQQFYLKQ